MIGIISTEENVIIDINNRLHEALTNAPVKYVAQKYADILQKDDEFAIRIVEKPLDWNEVIMQTLTQEEKENIQLLTWI
jgi:hypothetical protein